MIFGGKIRDVILKEHLPLIGWTALAVLYRGYSYAVGDQNLYLPFVLHWNDPSLFPNDYLFWLKFPRESLTWVALAHLVNHFDLKVVLLALYLATSYLTLWAAFRLGLAWSKQRLSAWVMVLLWTPVYELPGSAQDTMDPYLTTRNMAYMLAMWALVAFLKSKPFRVAFLLCGGVFVHLISEIQVVCACSLVYLDERRMKRFALLLVSIGGCVLAVLSLSRGAQGGHDMLGFYDSTWYAIAARGAGCLFPESWLPRYWVHIFVVLGAYVLLAGYAAVRREWQDADTLGLALVGCSVLLGLFAYAGSLSRVVLPVQLSLMRGHIFVVLVATLCMSRLIGRCIEYGRPLSLSLGALGAAFWMSDNAAAQVFAALVAVGGSELLRGEAYKRLGRWVISDKGRKYILMAILAVVSINALDYYFLIVPDFGWPSQGRWWSIWGFVCMSIAGAWLCRARPRTRLPLVLFLSFALFAFVEPTRFAVETLGRTETTRWFYAYSRPHRFLWYRYTPLLQARTGLAALVEAHVPTQATVIVPAGWDSFRLMTRRSSFVTLEDMVPAEFNRRYALEWYARFTALYGEAALEDYSSHTGAPDIPVATLLNLAERYRSIHLTYVITDRSYPLVEIGRFGGWTLYRLEPVEAALPILEK